MIGTECLLQMLASKTCKSQDDMHDTVMHAALQRLGDSIGDEVAKLEAEEHQFETVLEQISPESDEPQEDTDDQLAMKSDAAPSTPNDECGQARAELAELTEVICECRDLYNELRENLKLQVDSACNTGGDLG